MKTYDDLLQMLEKVREYKPSASSVASAHKAACPACGDGKPGKLCVAVRHDGFVMGQCYAGCSFLQVCHSLGVDPGDFAAHRARCGHEEQVTKGIKGWEWWSLVGALETLLDVLLVLLVSLADADRRGDLAAGRAATATAIGKLTAFKQQIQFGKGKGGKK